MTSCSCIKYEDQGIIPDPHCSAHREEKPVGEHSGEKKTFRDAVKPPETFNIKQRISWYIGLFIGVVIVCAGMALVVALLIALVRLFFALLAWLVG